MTSIRARDVQELLELVGEGFCANGAEPFPRSVLHGVARLIRSDACVGYQEADVGGAFRVVEQVEVVGEEPTVAVEAAFRALYRENPLNCAIRAREPRVLRLSDFMKPRRRRSLAYYAEVWRPHRIEDALRLWLPAPPGRARSIYLERSGPNYTDREKTLFGLLRPHLIGIRERRAAARSAHRIAELTEREPEILGHVDDGKTNAEIARLLFVSPHTVRKHLENAFEKLGVHKRTAAVAFVRARNSA